MSRQAPQFRPRRGAPDGRRKWTMLAVSAGVLALGVVALVVTLILTLGGDDDGSATLASGDSTSTTGTEGGAEPKIAGPASRYVPQSAEASRDYEQFGPDTYPLSALGWASNGHFTNAEKGEEQAIAWGYETGFQASFQPTGQLADVVLGKYFFKVESVLFDSLTGAHEAYLHLQEQHLKQKGSERKVTKGLGNESSAWEAVQGTVGTSDLAGVYHRFIFRRGNLVTLVQTYGAQPRMNIDFAREIAVSIDEKALGERPSPTPTPGSPNPSLPNLPSQTPQGR